MDIQAITKILSQKCCCVKMAEPKNKMLGTMDPPMQLSAKMFTPPCNLLRDTSNHSNNVPKVFSECDAIWETLPHAKN